MKNPSYRKAKNLHEDVHPFTATELDAILTVIQKSEYALWRGPVWIMCETGMRIKEIRDLKTVDFRDRSIILGPRRTIDLSLDLNTYLRSMIRARKERCFLQCMVEPEWMFTNSAGGQLYYASFYKAWKRILKEIKISFRIRHVAKQTTFKG